MQRKDKRKKITALRNKPVYSVGFRKSPDALENGFLRNDCPYKVVSLFSGCGGMDMGFMGGFSVLGHTYSRLPFDIVDAYDCLNDAVECYRLNIAENIHLARMQDGECLWTIVDDFQSCGYHFDVWNLYAPDYGVPQNRRRLFFIGVRDDIKGFPIKPVPTNSGKPVTISEALSDLEHISDETVTNQSQYFVSSCATSGGGQGDNVNEPDKVAYCIRANARGRIQFHYHLNRRLTVRECARVQTFPDAFVFPFTTQRNLTLIGNAVPPILAYAVAQSVCGFIRSVDYGTGNAVTMRREYNMARQEMFDL